MLGSDKGIVSGYYNDIHSMARDAASYSGKGTGVLWTPNPCHATPTHEPTITFAPTHPEARPLRIARFPKGVGCRLTSTLERPAGISATDDEHQVALDLAGQVESYLCGEMDFPPPVVIDSGNGAYLLFPVQLPNDQESEALVRDFLKALALRWPSQEAKAKIDTSTYNASRLIRVPGTMNCKGDSTLERPHRVVTMLKMPEVLAPVPVELIHTVAAREQPGTPQSKCLHPQSP